MAGLGSPIRVDYVGDGWFNVFVLDSMLVGQPCVGVFFVVTSGERWRRMVIESGDDDLCWGSISSEVEHGGDDGWLVCVWDIWNRRCRQSPGLS